MNISSVWWLRDGEREQNQNIGGATAGWVIIPAVFVLIRVSRIVIGVAPRIADVLPVLDVISEPLDPVIHDNVDSGSGSEAAVMDGVGTHPDNGNE